VPKSYRELLLSLANELHRNHKDDFGKAALELRGRKRPYFSERADDLRVAQKLLDGPMFGPRLNLAANAIVMICRALLQT
jgi:hypothetical protein